mmetsp:Transcript_7898/g.7744  ORF Transcript_7898/g.7744 Transcript_7898/m.7744 type:complete len:133 (+) Transcript_7898:322-720(+)
MTYVTILFHRSNVLASLSCSCTIVPPPSSTKDKCGCKCALACGSGSVSSTFTHLFTSSWDNVQNWSSRCNDGREHDEILTTLFVLVTTDGCYFFSSFFQYQEHTHDKAWPAPRVVVSKYQQDITGQDTSFRK